MENKLLTKAFEELKRKNYDGYFMPLSNEHLSEMVVPYDNLLVSLTGFTGDTGNVLIVKNSAYLIVDGRFTIQAKKEINDSRIQVVVIDKSKSLIEILIDKIKRGSKIALNNKLLSIEFVQFLSQVLENYHIKLVFDYKFLYSDFNRIKNTRFKFTSAPLFLLDNKYVGSASYDKIKEGINYLKTTLDKYDVNNILNAEICNIKLCDTKELNDDINYITSDVNEIAYLTNLRFKFSDIAGHGVLFKSFMIVNKKKSYLYIKDYIDDKTYKYLTKNKIIVCEYNDFYNDLKLYRGKNVFLDPTLNNHYIYGILSNKKIHLIDSPFTDLKSIRSKTEIKNLKLAHILDGVAMVKSIYKIKNDFVENSKSNIKNEYDVKLIVNNMRKEVGKSKFLTESFDTIVGYKENSAICHYTPTKNKSKKIGRDSLLLIDSGGNYLFGTTDITRTISLYNNKKLIPADTKKYYTMVLNANISLSMQVFPYGITGSELDIIARKDFYNNYIDFAHGTGHGIGYISSVHEGLNRIGAGIAKKYLYNIFECGQVVSDEPGIYFENKYGIRIENDLLTVNAKNNKYGEFLKFDILTLCPYDIDLIDKKYLDKKVIDYINKYNEIVYKKLSKFLTPDEKKWLKYETSKI